MIDATLTGLVVLSGVSIGLQRTGLGLYWALFLAFFPNITGTSFCFPFFSLHGAMVKVSTSLLAAAGPRGLI